MRGKDVSGIPAGVGYMFQQDAVLPWKTVSTTWRSARATAATSRAQARECARAWVDEVGLAGFEAYYPHQLSGGMRKRVALAQTLVNEPEILLMDEPFSALDVQTRALMQDELLRLWSGTGAAVVFVTHDLEEAIVLADRVVVMTASPATVKATSPYRWIGPATSRRSGSPTSSSRSTARSGSRCAKRSQSARAKGETRVA